MFGRRQPVQAQEQPKADIGFGIGTVELLFNSLIDNHSFTNAFDTSSVWEVMPRPSHGVLAFNKSQYTGGIITEQACELLLGNFDAEDTQQVVLEWAKLRKFNYSGFAIVDGSIQLMLYVTDDWNIKFDLTYHESIDPIPTVFVPATKLQMLVVPA